MSAPSCWLEYCTAGLHCLFEHDCLGVQQDNRLCQNGLTNHLIHATECRPQPVSRPFTRAVMMWPCLTELAAMMNIYIPDACHSDPMQLTPCMVMAQHEHMMACDAGHMCLH